MHYDRQDESIAQKDNETPARKILATWRQAMSLVGQLTFKQSQPSLDAGGILRVGSKT
jgi:hypothetical protein